MSTQTNVKDYRQEFKKIIEGFGYSRSIREVFTDWLDIAACAIHQEPYHLGLVPRDGDFDKMEAQYLAAVKKYSREELDAFAQLIGITKLALWEGKTDFLGQLYMEMEIGQERSGEFFTPYSISLMMAKMILANVDSYIEEKGFITVAEPACGGGGMLIAAAQLLEEAGHNPKEVLFFEATDISKPCCDMAYIQTSILGLSGIVRHGDTLRNQHWSSRFTPICRVFPARTNAFMESIISPKPEGSKQTEATPPTTDLSSPQSSESNQQALQLDLLSETENPQTLEEPELPQQRKKPKSSITTSLDNLSQEADQPGYEQGRLF